MTDEQAWCRFDRTASFVSTAKQQTSTPPVAAACCMQANIGAMGARLVRMGLPPAALAGAQQRVFAHQPPQYLAGVRDVAQRSPATPNDSFISPSTHPFAQPSPPLFSSPVCRRQFAAFTIQHANRQGSRHAQRKLATALGWNLF